MYTMHFIPRTWLALAVLVVVASPPCLAGNDGGAPGGFLRFGGSARSLALGNAVTGVADDVATSYWNPAGLAQLRTLELVATGAVAGVDHPQRIGPHVVIVPPPVQIDVGIGRCLGAFAFPTLARHRP